jgi:hypothetical protein
MLFLPGFIEPQTNRLQHVFRDLEAYGIPELLGGPQWAEYKQHTLRRYYREWLLFFQRRPGKVVRCAGCVGGDAPCTWGGHAVDMGGEPARVKAGLALLQMDHSIPKHAICTQWRRLVEAHRHRQRPTHQVSAAPHFTDGVNIGYVNHLLFSVSEDLDWGAPVVQPRCLVGGGQRLNCHKGELEHCLAIGLYDFSQLGLGGADGVLGMLPHAGGVGVAHGDEGDSSHDVVLVSDDDDEGAVIDVVLVSSDDDDDEGVVVIDVVMVSSDDDEDEDVRVRW